MNVGIGVGRPVVKDEFLAPGARLAQAAVQAVFVPFLNPAGLALGQVAAHGEGRVGQVEGFAVVGLAVGTHGGGMLLNLNQNSCWRLADKRWQL